MSRSQSRRSLAALAEPPAAATCAGPADRGMMALSRTSSPVAAVGRVDGSPGKPGRAVPPCEAQTVAVIASFVRRPVHRPRITRQNPRQNPTAPPRRSAARPSS